jgi:hypothetical protein
MPDFKILKVTIDRATRNEKIYFRVERIGSNTWGGIQKYPYPTERIIKYHINEKKRKNINGQQPTPLDIAAAEAKTIDVKPVSTDGLKNIMPKDANKVRNSIVAKFMEDNHDWPKLLLNVYGLGKE